MKIYRACYKKVQGTCLLDCNQRRKWEKHSRRHYATPIQVIIVKSRENYLLFCFHCWQYQYIIHLCQVYRVQKQVSSIWKSSGKVVLLENWKSQCFYRKSLSHILYHDLDTMQQQAKQRSSPSDELFSLVPPAVLAFEIFSPVSLIFSSF